MSVVVCPCCRSEVRLVSEHKLEIVRIEKPLPGEEWQPRTKGPNLADRRRRSIHEEAVAIIRKVGADHGFSLLQLRSASRRQDLVKARQAAALAAYERTDVSTSQIGRILNRDHSTIVHGLQKSTTSQRAA